jgi:broad specificity phosphatase PhoE
MLRQVMRHWLQRLLMWNEMPSDLVLVRHGESEGNAAGALSKNGDHTWYNHPEFSLRHSSQWRLTENGRQQARQAKSWIRKNVAHYLPGKNFFRQYVSSYTRARETAGLLNLPGNWYEHFFLRERDYGYFDTCSKEERFARYAEEAEHFRRHSFVNAPPNGESMANLCIRVHLMNGTLGRECARQPVILVCHGEWMWGERVLLERMPLEGYQELDASKHPHDRIHNCQILWYTRREPGSHRNKLAPYFGWKQSVCPWDLSLSLNVWEEITRPSYTSAELRERAERILQIVY